MPPADTLLVEGLEFVGHHGFYPRERRDGCRFRVDVEATFDGRPAAASDALDDTVSYDDIAETVIAVGQGETRFLVERLAEQMCAALLSRHPITSVTLTLRKLAPMVAGTPSAVGIRITRSRA